MKIYEYPEGVVEVTAVVAYGCEMMIILKQLSLSMNKIPLSYGLARLLLSRCLSFQSSYQCLGKYKHYKSVSVKFSKCCHFSATGSIFREVFAENKSNIVYEAMNTTYAFRIFVRSQKTRNVY